MKEQVTDYVTRGIAALFAIMLHEIAHGFAAYKLGDPTARDAGRLTLNPLKHVDWFGLLALIVAGFGWAKPVPVDMRHFNDQKRGMAITALAGPLMNFLLAFLSLILLFNVTMPGFLITFFYIFTMINIGLGVFNLFPVPPLDGSKILGAFLPDRIYYTLLRYERYGMGVLFLLLFLGVLNAPLGFLRDAVLNAFISVIRSV